MGGTRSWQCLLLFGVVSNDRSRIRTPRAPVELIAQIAAEDKLANVHHDLHLVNTLNQKHMRAPNSNQCNCRGPHLSQSRSTQSPSSAFPDGTNTNPNCDLWSHSMVHARVGQICFTLRPCAALRSAIGAKLMIAQLRDDTTARASLCEIHWDCAWHCEQRCVQYGWSTW